jgi:hypothetical protein
LCFSPLSSRSALWIDIGGHVSPQSLVHAISSLVDFLPCHFVRLSSISSFPVVSLCPSYPLFCQLLLYFLTFLFLIKMCLMNLDCFFLNSLIVFVFSLLEIVYSNPCTLFIIIFNRFLLSLMKACEL